jgi:transcriptional regulator with XRE-family HTH domain
VAESDHLADLGRFIREQRGAARMSLRRLSEVAGISNPYLSQIERGLRKPSAEILQQLAKALRVSAETIYVHAGILDPSATSSVVTAIEADEALREAQKQALLQIYRSFVSENAQAATSAPTEETA